MTATTYQIEKATYSENIGYGLEAYHVFTISPYGFKTVVESFPLLREAKAWIRQEATK